MTGLRLMWPLSSVRVIGILRPTIDRYPSHVLIAVTHHLQNNSHSFYEKNILFSMASFPNILKASVKLLLMA